MNSSSTRDERLAEGLPQVGTADTPLITSMLVQKFTFSLRDEQGNEIARMKARSAQHAFDAYVQAHGVVPHLVEEV